MMKRSRARWIGATVGLWLSVGGCEDDSVAPVKEQPKSRGIAGVNGDVRGIAVVDSLVYVGGVFSVAGLDSARNVARWDGVCWEPMGAGVEMWVLSVCAWNNRIYVGGAGRDGITLASWDGATWEEVGGGVSRLAGGSGEVLGIFGNSDGLVVVGNFDYAGSVEAKNIAKWNGTSWESMGSGVNYTCFAAISWGDNLIAGGQFTQAGGVDAAFVAAWDGNAWEPIGSGLGAIGADCLGVNEVGDGLLYAGGKFASAGGASAANIASWNGLSWQQVGGGVNDRVRAITPYGDDVFVAGDFTMAGNVEALGIARWDGLSWHSLDSEGHSFVGTYEVVSNGLGVLIGGSRAGYPQSNVSGVVQWNGVRWVAMECGAP